MMKLRWVPRVAALAMLVAAVSACGGSSKPSASGSQSNKSAFCSADVTLDKAGNNAGSAQDVIAVLKANPSAIAALQNDAPAGKVGTEAKALAQAARTSVASNNIDALGQLPTSYGGDLDTYCGVDGNGDPLPAFFAKGQGSAFCGPEAQINDGTSNAQSNDDVLTFLKAHQDLITQLSQDLSGVPNPVNTEVQGLIAASQQAISTGNSDGLGTDQVTQDFNDAALYCGENQ